MSPASKTHRREYAILAALRAAGTPLQIKHLIRAASQLGPDAPQVEATIPRMLKAGDIELAPGQEHGTAMRFLYVQLPGCTASAPAHYPDPCSKPLLPPEPAPYAVESELLDDPDPFARPRTPTPTPEPVMLATPESTAIPAALVAKRRGRPPKNPAAKAPSSPVEARSVAREGEGSTPTAVEAGRGRKVEAMRGVAFNPEAGAAWDTMRDDLSASLGFQVTHSQLVMYLFTRYGK